MIEDAGEIAQLASEYISTLENLPQEVQHIVKEIEHKDAKVQELLPKVAAREAQLRELIGRREAVLSDGDRVKADKLTDKIKADYVRADEWSAQKERLSRDLWRNIHAHSKRLEAEIARIAPALVQQVEASLSGTLTPQAQLLPSSTSISSAVLGALRSPSVEASLEIAVPTTGTLKRKFSAASPAIKGGRQSSTDRGLPSPSPLSGPAFTPSASAGAGSAAGSGQHKKMKHSSLSVVTKAPPPSSELDIDADGEAAGGEEKDDRVYCHCQRISFGEMIGCDSDECPYEWFHLTCVGLSKPLPQTWYCTDCRERMEREKSERPTKKRKKQPAAG